MKATPATTRVHLPRPTRRPHPDRWSTDAGLVHRPWRSVLALGLALVLCAGCQTWLDRIDVGVGGRGALGVYVPDGLRDGTAARTEPAATVPAEQPVVPDGVLTLEVARRLAVQSNPDGQAARARMEAAGARMDEARARLLPTVAATHTSARTFHTPTSRNRLNTLLQPAQPVPTDVDAPPRTIALTTIINALRLPLFGSDPVGNANSYSEHSSSLTATWLIFDGHVREAQAVAAEYLRRAAGASLADVERLIVQAVDAAYYQVQLAQEQIRIAEADEAFSREQLAETEKLQAAGRATQADVDNFRVRALAARANVIAAVGRRETGRVMLAELMGVEDVTLPPAWALSPLAEETESDMAVPDAQPWVERAAAHRPDLRQLESILQSEEHNVRAAKGLYSPTVAFSGSWGYDRSAALRYSRQDQSTAGAIDFRWDVYTGGARRARVRAAESTRAEAAAVLQRLRLAVQAEVRRAVIDLTDAQEQIRLRRESLETARENRRVIRAAYLAGKETLTRLNEAQRDYIEAEANLALARIRLRLAWSDLFAAAASDGRVDQETPGDTP